VIFNNLKIQGLVEILPKVFEDPRGFFYESYNKKIFFDNGIDIEFVQDNRSRSNFNTLRGLHFQLPPFAQDKLVRVTSGEVLDVAVDIRANSPTFGQYETVSLSADKKNMFFIPKGFAHGFIVLSESADFEYKVSNFYSKEHDRGIVWNDPTINIDWNTDTPLLSDKDSKLPFLQDIVSQIANQF
jgi:dTDP-4-dehydrorhamnose 3,5-epimerase